MENSGSLGISKLQSMVCQQSRASLEIKRLIGHCFICRRSFFLFLSFKLKNFPHPLSIHKQNVDADYVRFSEKFLMLKNVSSILPNLDYTTYSID